MQGTALCGVYQVFGEITSGQPEVSFLQPQPLSTCKVQNAVLDLTEIMGEELFALSVNVAERPRFRKTE
jgi:hypothetical protein